MKTSRKYMKQKSTRMFISAGMLLVLAMGLHVDAQAQYLTSHTQMGLVINSGDSECSTLSMTLIDNYTWVCDTPIPIIGNSYFQFWPGEAQDMKYGSPGTQWDLVYEIDPANAVHAFTSPGYYTFLMYEDEMRYDIIGASGSITASVSYSNVPAFPPVDTSVLVFDDTAGIELCRVPSIDGFTITVTNLLLDHSYNLTFAASGYSSRQTTVLVNSTTPVEVDVTLEYIVANEQRNWGVIKALYR